LGCSLFGDQRTGEQLIIMVHQQLNSMVFDRASVLDTLVADMKRYLGHTWTSTFKRCRERVYHGYTSRVRKYRVWNHDVVCRGSAERPATLRCKGQPLDALAGLVGSLFPSELETPSVVKGPWWVTISFTSASWRIREVAGGFELHRDTFDSGYILVPVISQGDADRAARAIQRAWSACSEDPVHPVCRRKLMRWWAEDAADLQGLLQGLL
jgi:hypothetical protein